MTDQVDQLYRKIGENAPDALMYADREGIIRLWNHGAELIFGHTATEAIGQSLDLIIPEAMRARHWEGYYRVMATGQTIYATRLLSTPAMHKDGRRISVEFSVIMVKDTTDAVAGIGAILRDASERREKERALLARIAALEAS